MRKEQISRLKIYKDVTACIESAPESIALNLELAKAGTELKGIITAIFNVIETKRRMDSEREAKKDPKKEKLCKDAAAVSAILRTAKITPAKESYEDLAAISDERIIIEKGQGIHNTAQKNISHLKDYGLTLSLLGFFQSMINDYPLSEIIKEKKIFEENYNRALRRLFKIGNQQLREIDRSVILIKKTNKNFVENYKKARRIIILQDKDSEQKINAQ